MPHFFCSVENNISAENKFKVLVVDDEPAILELLEYNFSKKGARVTLAKNGVEGLEKAERELPQVIVLDIMMPVMSGIEMCRALKADPVLRNIPVLFLSASNDDALILSAMTAGGDHFVSKPIKISLLFEIVNGLQEEFKQNHSA
jgi:two-component system, OmpR family, alkaline phosphatase synthesis response regulator PhoP